MSSNDPYSAMFETQRSMIENSRTLLEGGLRMQRTAAETFLGTFEATKTVQKSGVSLTQRGIHAYLDSMEGAMPEGSIEELRTMVDEQYEALDEAHDDAWNAYEESTREFLDAYDELSEAQLEQLDQFFDMLLNATADAEEVVDETATDLSDAVEVPVSQD